MNSIESISHLQELRLEIEKKRSQMIVAGMEYGLTDNRTLKLGQELDNLFNEYRRLQSSFTNL